jgi:hypothetical protein
VIRQVLALEHGGIPSGINLLVRASHLEEAKACARQVQLAGIGNHRIVYIPIRGHDTPSVRELARVAGGRSFK